jgi:hypothetical protein
VNTNSGTVFAGGVSFFCTGTDLDPGWFASKANPKFKNVNNPYKVKQFNKYRTGTVCKERPGKV